VGGLEVLKDKQQRFYLTESDFAHHLPRILKLASPKNVRETILCLYVSLLRGRILKKREKRYGTVRKGECNASYIRILNVKYI